MAEINTAGLHDAALTPAKTGFLAAIGGPQFLAGQIFTVVATILGVYLAGYVGYQRTVEHDILVNAQQQTNLVQALGAEMKHNTERLQSFAAALEKTMDGEPVYREWPRLHLFIWRASAQNPTVFDTPPQTLADMQAFYEGIGDMLANAEMQKAFRSITTSNTADRRSFIDRFNAQIKTATGAILPALEKAADASQQLVTKYSSGGI